MAKKVAPADPVGEIRQPTTSAATTAADELQALDPTVSATVGGEEVVIREYGIFQKARVMRKGSTFIADLQQVVGSATDADDVWDDARLLIGDHEDFVLYAIGEAIGKPAEWVRGLPESDLELLVYLWFSVAGRFFFQEVAHRARGRRLRAELAGSTSSTPLAGMSKGLGSTPNAN